MPFPRNQSGFTLVELAIALMIIGLLIAGVLKGIELAQNAKVTQMVRQVAENRTAMASFVSGYRKLPGDIANPSALIPGCSAAPCNSGGNEDNRILGGTEPFNFWIHQQKAGFLTGFDGNASTVERGSPVTALGGHIFAVFKTPADFPAHPYRGANYFAYYLADGVTPSLRSIDVAKMDQKLDDGMPYSGDVRAQDNIGDVCVRPDDTYNETDDTELCLVFIRARY